MLEGADRKEEGAVVHIPRIFGRFQLQALAGYFRRGGVHSYVEDFIRSKIV